MIWAGGSYSRVHGLYISTFTTQVFPGMLQDFVENIALEEHAFCVDHLHCIGVV